MKEWSFHDAQTGEISARTFFSTDTDAVALNTPPGHAAIEGRFDHLSQRVDLSTGEVIDYQPPQPSADHEWNATTKRWQLTAEAQGIIEADRKARADIERQEGLSLRAIRELLLDPSNAEARAKLQATDDAIAAERPKVKK